MLLKHYRFPWQRKDEVVKMVMRSFLPSLLISLSSILLLFFIPVILFFTFFENQGFYYAYREVINSFILLWLALGVLWVLYLWYGWFFDICIVTNQRIVDIDQQGFFHQKVSEASLGKIQDVVYEIKGFLQTIFNIGNVTIYTSGSEAGFTFENVLHPQSIHQAIRTIIEEFNDTQDKPVTTRELFTYLQQQQAKTFENNLPQQQWIEKQQQYRENPDHTEDFHEKNS